jgi:predicted DNA-binding transcriptional regulator AlpA
MSKRITRPKEGYHRLGCGHTKFWEDYVLNDPDDPFVPNTKIPRLKRIPLGPRNIGFLDSEIDELIDALAAERTDQSQRTFPQSRVIGHD